MADAQHALGEEAHKLAIGAIFHLLVGVVVLSKMVTRMQSRLGLDEESLIAGCLFSLSLTKPSVQNDYYKVINQKVIFRSGIFQ